MYSGYGITFDSGDSLTFVNDVSRNIIIFGVDKSLSSHADSRENNFLVLGEGLPFGIEGRFGSAEKKFSIWF